ncbi:methyl-accepting chemotaxis protein [Microbacteriaceae bacterium K1510]|nr:methyl-accepting chemotaxis protein [Microbacteriaceae bacterium K1510]
MIRLSNIRIGTKLMVMSGLGILLVVGMILSLAFGNLSVRSAQSQAAFNQDVQLQLVNAKAALSSLQVAGRDVRLAQTSAELQRATKNLEDRHKAVRGFLDPLTTKYRLAEDRERGQKVTALADQYLAASQDIVKARKELVTIEERQLDAISRSNELNQLIARIGRERLIPMADEMDGLIDQSVKSSDTLAAREVTNAEQAMGSAEMLNYAMGAVAVLVLVGAAIFGSVSIARPLMALVSPINELAAGKFNVVIDGVGRKDEVGQIATAVNAMATRVRDTIAEIKMSAMEVNSASGEISHSTTDLSQRTEEQAASLEETTAAMEEISATVRKSAENAEEANRSASEARNVADRGGKVVAKAVDAMAKIEDSSRKIADIIGVIDEIARQTNLLALNAAVEAARAGEAGRGFAVVASEVRSLAQRSSQAAKDIKELITNSNGQVQEGVELVNHAGAALSEILASVKSVADLVADIAVASNEQASGLDQINKALMQMDEATQQNAALVEENAATAKALETQAQSMDERVAFFKIDDGVSAAIAPKRAKAVVETPVPVVTKPEAPKAAPVRKPATAKRAASAGRGGPVGRMQTALATALDAEPEWKDF